MEVDSSVIYHPTLRILCNEWLKQPMTARSLNFLMYVGVLHNDKKLTAWCLQRGANINAPPEKWYKRFLGNLKITVESE